MKRPRRTASSLSASLHRQLNMYALAASAAGVSMLALSPRAEAKIVYFPANITIGHGGVQIYNLDLNHDGIADFSISTRGSCEFSCSRQLGARGSTRGDEIEFNGFKRGLHSGAALHLGAKIGAKNNFDLSAFLASGFGYKSHYYSKGNWANVRRYLGLEFQIKGKTHFGWARLSVSVQKLNITAKLTGYAYETIPGKPIIAGREHGKDEATLGRLAQGASGVAASRQKQ